MKLISLKLKNYKKHSDSYFEFGNNVNIILGENNSGKSTLLEVMNAIFNDDPKFFKDFPNVELEATFDNNFCKLNLSGKSPKFDWTDDSRPTIPAFVPVNMGTTDIEKILSSFLENQLKANEELKSILNSEFDTFQNSLGLNNISTVHIREENDLYNLNHSIEYKKMFTFSFGNEPTSIKNKGMGQQKEFILNYFIQKSTMSNTDYLFVDEIENSLSVESMINVVNSLCNLNKQIFLTSHSSAILETNVSSIVLIGPAPKAIFKSKNFIYLEGPSDFEIFSRIFPGVKFMTANGGVDKVAKAYNQNGDDFVAIVDGDAAGLQYKANINTINSTFNVLTLRKGCIEDYYDEQSKINAYAKANMIAPTNIPTDFLHNSPLDNASIPNESDRKQKRNIIKNHLSNNGNFVDADLQIETNAFISANS